MARHGLPKRIIEKYGISKEAWRVYRRERGGHHRRSGRRSRNPVGHPGSGPDYRPRFHRTGRGRFRHSRRGAARLPSTIRVRSRTTGRHGRRGHHSRTHHSLVPWSGPRRNPESRHHRRSHGRRRRNPETALARPFHRLRGGEMGRVLSHIPLTQRADWTAMRQHKLGSVLGLAGGLAITGAFVSFGGTWAGLALAFLPAIAFKAYSKRPYLAGAWLLGGLLATALGVFSSGSLAGPAALGDTLTNLQAQIANVSAALPAGLTVAIPTLAAPSIKGLSGMSLPEFQWKLKRLQLKGLGELVYTHNPYGGWNPAGFRTNPFPKSGWGTAGLGSTGNAVAYKGFNVVDVHKGMGTVVPAPPNSSWSMPVTPNRQALRMAGLGDLLPSGNSRWLTVNA